MDKYLNEAFDEQEISIFRDSAIGIIKMTLDYLNSLDELDKFNLDELKDILTKSIISKLDLDDDNKDKELIVKELYNNLSNSIDREMIINMLQGVIIQMLKDNVIYIAESNDISNDSFEKQGLVKSEAFEPIGSINEIHTLSKYKDVYVVFLGDNYYSEIDLTNKDLSKINLPLVINLQHLFNNNDYQEFNKLIKGKELEVLRTFYNIK